ncbi:MFS transporter [Bradyrhizobium sp. SSBR45G]|uniref:MFS transporter n=1 Tax=unclassified Bradyrhizobium TaxID=2631580 RepID=UPI002342A443|nr:MULTISPECIES: MFS transporter [unclassified Bradyrhizobium]GLH79879.1 MFS transporter [Bradyrhizobium sp. SSBR45G]GLH87255.1 MFS transporter [Bradyrhizobium sp. SSBR45R]
MSTVELAEERAPAATRLGLHLALLQLVFSLLWTTYVIYLPKLAAEAGIAPSAVILILMLDQAIFTLADTAMGIAADRLGRIAGRFGLFIGLVTAVSCCTFVALPFVAGSVSPAVFIGLIAIWALTSSVLRAPPLTLLGRHAARPAVPFLTALVMLGYGVAGAVSPYLGVVMRDYDPRLPFIISSAVLLLTALGVSRIAQVGGLAAKPVTAPAEPKPLRGLPLLFIGAMVILALGYQLHFSINSSAFYLRFAKPEDLSWLMPVFWIGFNLVLFPASVVVKHRGGLIVMGIAGLLGAIAIVIAELAGALTVLIVAQFIAGAAWGCMMMSAISAALAIGSTGAEGKVTGLVFSALALATFARIAAVAGGLQKLPDYAPLVQWAPVACWLVAGAGLLAMAAAGLQGRQASPP